MLFDTSILKRLAERAESLLTRVETLLPRQAEPDWDASVAFRWRRRPTAFGWQSWLQPVRHRATIALEDLQNIDEPKRLIERNTRRFVQGLPANNVLLTGSRGTGKSSLIKACLNAHAHEGLRLIEVDKADLVDLPDIVDLVGDRPEKFIVYCDDLSFEEGEAGYKALKTALDGSVAAASDNVLIYATSNRRHLMPERMSENLAAKHTEDGEIHPGETSEEKISLSERFGLWVAFYPFRQDDYLAVVAHWLRHFGCDDAQVEAARADALRWALERGSRSGRVAWQFARDWAGGRPAPRRAAKANAAKANAAKANGSRANGSRANGSKANGAATPDGAPRRAGSRTTSVAAEAAPGKRVGAGTAGPAKRAPAKPGRRARA